jgi:hypothetical protein
MRGTKDTYTETVSKVTDFSRKQLIQKIRYRRRYSEIFWSFCEAEPLGKFHRFCRNLLENFDHLWVFLRVPDMEPTNNEAERSIRSLVLYRKKSLGTKSDLGMLFVATISTICQTLRKQGRKILHFITQALQSRAPFFC